MGKNRIGSLLLVVLATCSSWAASSYKVLHAFGAGNDGAQLEDSVALDAKGHVYGATVFGGAYGYGTVFKLTQKPDGHWVEKPVHSFQNGDPDGQQPLGGVVLDRAGNLYGVTSFGAKHAGNVIQLAPSPSGWSLSVIYAFCSQPDCSDGSGPQASMVFDSEGNLYGTAFNVFKLTPGPDSWTESVLCDVSCDRPTGGLLLDAKGNLYGTTQVSGTYNEGTVFKLKPMPDGTWKERVLYSFGGFAGDGRQPGKGGLAFDAAGNLYGTTLWGGRYARGIVFRLSRQPDGHWKESILHHFKLGKSGNHPAVGVVVDASGNLYGVTGYGGAECDCGVVYKLAPNPDGTWTYTVLHRFNGNDGFFPYANLVLDGQGNLYGTTEYGGSGGGGVVFRITP
jgi:uncharacterized repeat protein (TIGR03803 family)